MNCFRMKSAFSALWITFPCRYLRILKVFFYYGDIDYHELKIPSSADRMSRLERQGNLGFHTALLSLSLSRYISLHTYLFPFQSPTLFQIFFLPYVPPPPPPSLMLIPSLPFLDSLIPYFTHSYFLLFPLPLHGQSFLTVQKKRAESILDDE